MPLIVVRLDLSGADLEHFEAYEARVLPLLADHGAALLVRRRNPAQNRETHVIRFATNDGFQSYLHDPRRLALAPMRERSGVTSKVRFLGSRQAARAEGPIGPKR